MGQVVVITWPNGAIPVQARRFIGAAEAAGWSSAHHEANLWIGVHGRRAAMINRLHADRTIVVGEVFWGEARLPPQTTDGPMARARHLVRHAWGRYLALFRSDAGEIESVLRDPSGALDCAVWTDGGCTVLASCLPDWLLTAGSRRWVPDLERVADILADPTLLSGPIALAGVTSVAPGEWRAFDGRTLSLWRPGELAVSGSHSPHSDRARLRSAVDRAVQALSCDHDALVEVSGGLDSAIVATARQALVSQRRTVWTNTSGPYAEADERAYAAAICDRMGAPLTCLERARPTDASGLCLEHPRALRPSVNRMDALYDREQAAFCRSLKLDLILTGKGGDVAFYQTATSAILADRLRERGLAALADPCLPVLSRRLRRSVWSVLWRAITASGRARGFGGSGRPALGLAAQDIIHRRTPPHPWLTALDDVAPGKRQQIAGFAGNLSLHGLSQRTEAADLVHPLLSQPVMETCLATPTWRLTGGGHDRFLAREAFGDRLPTAIVERRSKGELAVYYGHVVAAAVDALKPHLLEGRLAAAGLIDTAQVEAALQPDHLIWQGGYGDLMMLALIESWLRSWDQGNA